METKDKMEKMLNSHLSECLKNAMLNFVGNTYSHDNPVRRIFDSVVADNGDLIRSTFTEAIKDAFNSSEFRAEIRHQTMKKLAQTVVSQCSGLADKQLNQLKQDPVFKANMTLLISQSLAANE